jgi:hypothetical protein
MTTEKENLMNKFFKTLSTIAVITLFAAACGGQTKPTKRVLDWGVLDKTTNINTDVSSGGSFKIDGKHEYIVTLRAKDPDGIKQLAVWGDGIFTCGTALNRDLQNREVDFLPASFRRKETAIPSAGSYDGFVMSDRLIYYNLSCGQHIYGGVGSVLEDYWVASGTLNIHGEEISWSGTATTATLDLMP